MCRLCNHAGIPVSPAPISRITGSGLLLSSSFEIKRIPSTERTASLRIRTHNESALHLGLAPLEIAEYEKCADNEADGEFDVDGH